MWLLKTSWIFCLIIALMEKKVFIFIIVLFYVIFICYHIYLLVGVQALFCCRRLKKWIASPPLRLSVMPRTSRMTWNPLILNHWPEWTERLPSTARLHSPVLVGEHDQQWRTRSAHFAEETPLPRCMATSGLIIKSRANFVKSKKKDLLNGINSLFCWLTLSCGVIN